MPVVINEFEVVAEPPAPSKSAPAEAKKDGNANPPWTVHDVAEMVARARERAARVRAD